MSGVPCPFRRAPMSIRPLARAVALAAIAASSQAGEIRGRVLVDGKPAAGVAVAVLPFEDGFEEARREARREDLPAPLAWGEDSARRHFRALVVPGLSQSATAVVSLALSGGGLAALPPRATARSRRRGRGRRPARPRGSACGPGRRRERRTHGRGDRDSLGGTWAGSMDDLSPVDAPCPRRRRARRTGPSASRRPAPRATACASRHPASRRRSGSRSARARS